MNTITGLTTSAVTAVKRAVNEATGNKPKAKVATQKAEKPVDAVAGAYPGLKHWPKAAGPVPSRELIMIARALGLGNHGTKRELAIAAYLRPEAASYNTNVIAMALVAVSGGKHNPLLNVVNRDACSTYGYCKVTKTKVEGGTAYSLELTAKGKARVAKFMATNAPAVATEAVKPVEGAAETPVEAAMTVAADEPTPVEYGVDTERELSGDAA